MDKTIKQVVAANNKQVMLSWGQIGTYATYALGGLGIGASAALGVGVYVANNYFKPKKKKNTTPTLSENPVTLHNPYVLCVNGTVYFTQAPSSKFKVPSNNNIVFTIATDSGIKIDPTAGIYSCKAEKIIDADNKPYPNSSASMGFYPVKKDKSNKYTVIVPEGQKSNFNTTAIYAFTLHGTSEPLFVTKGQNTELTSLVVPDGGVVSHPVGDYDVYVLDEFVNDSRSPSSIKSAEDTGAGTAAGASYDAGAAGAGAGTAAGAAAGTAAGAAVDPNYI